MKKVIFTFLSVVCMIVFTSCNKDGDESFIPDNLIGNWCGVYYDNQGREGWLNVSLYSDGTGDLQVESPTGLIVYAEFNYNVSGNTIKCKGASANTNGNVNENYSITFLMDEDYLIPQDHYTQFILAKDGLVEVNANGEIVEDQSELLQNVWISENGYELYDFKSKNKMQWYELYEPSSKKYTVSFAYEYSYDYKFKDLILSHYSYQTLYINQYTIVKLDSESLILKSKDTNKEYKYKRGSKSDIPTQKVDKYFGY